MTSGDRQRRQDGAPKRVQLTSGDHGGPKDKRKGKGKSGVMPASRAQRQAAAKKEWKSLFERIAELKRRDQERQQRRDT
jgi:hypothetical protein